MMMELGSLLSHIISNRHLTESEKTSEPLAGPRLPFWLGLFYSHRPEMGQMAKWQNNGSWAKGRCKDFG